MPDLNKKFIFDGFLYERPIIDARSKQKAPLWLFFYKRSPLLMIFLYEKFITDNFLVRKGNRWLFFYNANSLLIRFLNEKLIVDKISLYQKTPRRWLMYKWSSLMIFLHKISLLMTFLYERSSVMTFLWEKLISDGFSIPKAHHRWLLNTNNSSLMTNRWWLIVDKFYKKCSLLMIFIYE